MLEWAVVTTAMLVTALMFGVYPFMASSWAMGACSVLWGLRLMTMNASSVLMPLLFGTAGAVMGVSLVFWCVGLAVSAGARTAWTLRPAPGPHGV